MTRTPINCESGQQVAPSFQAIVTFNEDGTLTGYAVPPSSSPALGSPEYGVWQREGEVRHLIAKTLVDHSSMLQGLVTRSRDFH